MTRLAAIDVAAPSGGRSGLSWRRSRCSCCCGAPVLAPW